MLVFGGFVDGGERTNELWSYLYGENRWILLSKSKSGPVPRARASHSAVIRGGNMIIFGGCDLENEKMNDIWVYNIEANTWTEI